jgi:hypothetical protein
VISEWCFVQCKLLSLITFDSISKFQRVEDHAFASTALTDLIVPGCITSFSGSALTGVKIQTFSLSGISTIIAFAGLFCKISVVDLSFDILEMKEISKLIQRLKSLVNPAFPRPSHWGLLHLK